MLAEIEKRFRSGKIRNGDCDLLKKIIATSDDESALESAIYIFGRSCNYDPGVLVVCHKYLDEQPIPGLTAVCMRVACDYWNLWEIYKETISRYLDLDLYEEWYDEVLFVCGFCLKLTNKRNADLFCARLDNLMDRARREGVSELVELARDA
jgi:hypothetical protein